MLTRLFLVAAILLLGGCSGAPSGGEEGAFSLARHPELVVDIRLPETNRPKGAPLKGPYPLRKAFERLRANETVVEYGAPSPFRTVYYTKHTRKRPPEMTLRHRGKELPFEASGSAIGSEKTWGYDKGQLVLRLPVDAPPPELVHLGFPMAKKAEDALNFGTAEMTKEAFVFRSLPLVDTVEQGLFLPAPGSLSFKVLVPRDGQLRFTAHLVRPAVPAVLKSDGARLLVEVEHEGVSHAVGDYSLEPGNKDALSVPLDRFAGKEIHLKFRTETAGTPRFDYVFLGEPILRTPTKTPQKLLLVFIDTLRSDHMGMYGYSRDTTPRLDAWATQALVFENARAPAPWTLPSALSALTGFLPEQAQEAPHLGELLSEQGWRTVSVVSNSWLSGNFGLGDGWTQHSARIASPASVQVDAAIAAFEEAPDQDVAVMVHFIDPHLPYSEPKKFRGVFAEEAPPLLPRRVDNELVRAAWEKAASAERAGLKDYVVARYDQNIRYVDAELGRLLDAVGSEATVVVFSDHGEEFWEHGGFEHGHTLYDELLRVPMIMSGPGIQPGRVGHPVSLTDIVPTVLDHLGLPTPLVQGGSLTALLRGEPVDWETRALGFGSNLFGNLAWGVVADGKKWVVAGGRQQFFNLNDDPGEMTDLGAPPKDVAKNLRAHFQGATGRAVHPFVRVAATGENRTWGGSPTSVRLRSDVEFIQAFGAVHPVGDFAQPAPVPGGVDLSRVGAQRMPREFFVQPDRKLGEELSFSLDLVGASEVQHLELDLSPLGAEFQPLSSGRYGARTLEVGWTWMPDPASFGGTAPEVDTTEALRELGYLE
jgi:arylsulfatase A-like enzyme